MIMERQADPKGDRVRQAMTGKFLPLKDKGAQGNEARLMGKEG